MQANSCGQNYLEGLHNGMSLPRLVFNPISIRLSKLNITEWEPEHFDKKPDMLVGRLLL